MLPESFTMTEFLNQLDTLKSQDFVVLLLFWCKLERQFTHAVQLSDHLVILELLRILKHLLCPKDTVLNTLELNRPQIPYTKSDEEPQNLTYFRFA
jgi:hypothetical protein